MFCKIYCIGSIEYDKQETFIKLKFVFFFLNISVYMGHSMNKDNLTTLKEMNSKLKN